MIHIKAKQQNVSFEKNVEKLAFVLSAHLYHTLEADKVIEEAAKRSGISTGVIKAAWDAAGEVIRTWATEGHNIPLPGLGSMRFSVRSKSVQNIEDVKTSLITARRVIFTPAKEVKDELQATKISITCYDKDGNIVKRVTSADTNDVEEGEDEGEENQNGSNGSNGSSGSSENNGSSGSSGSSSGVAAPTISGTTPFDDSTTVTIAAAEDASIKYTTNGIDPTATYGNDYEDAITLNASATVKAVAIVNGVASSVASKVFTKNGSQGGSGEEGM